MKLTKIFLLAMALFAALVSQFSLAIAGEIPGYIGQQSFRLTDDPQLSDLTRRAEDAKVEVARIDQTRAQIQDQVNRMAHDRDAAVSRMNDLQRGIDGAKATKVSLQAKLDELNKDPATNKDQIAQVQAQMTAQDQQIAQLSQQYGASKIELGNINVRLDQINHDLQVATQNSQTAMARLQQISRDRDSYRQDLIASIQMINREGANRGQVDGTNDGGALATRLGQDSGSRDGNNDGLNQGTLDGQDRWYKRGADQGERDGSARAQADGQRDGTNQGTADGNSSAGSREGRVAGLKRGDASDAAQVGIAQGKKAGMDRAVRTGAVDGNNKGENETVQKFESGNLNSISVNGAFSGLFSGAFSRRSPDYPGDFNGQSYNPNVFNSRDVMKRAYADGYVDQYRQYTRYEYLRRIDGIYNSAYDGYYASAYNQAANRDYPAYYEQGRKDADARAYNRDYPVVRAQAYQVAFAAADSNPARTSNEYKSSYKSSELAAYNERYEAIRSANFDRTELDTFNANIAAQTEIYRQKRIGEVTTVYNNNAVLAFVSSEMFDGGINGVAKQDGVFQPGETTLHTVTLKNFGMKDALNVSVKLDNGDVVQLPTIAARSVVKVVGAGKSSIAATASIGSTARTSLSVISKLTSDDVVEAAHYDSIGNGILKSADQKSVRVAYPLALSSLSLSSQLLKGVANKLSITVTNNSKRAYAGEMKVAVLANSQSQVISKDFSAISSLTASSTLSDAEVLVTDEKDIYRDLSFSATITQNGVTLGVLGSDLVTMAKAQYAEKAKAAVIVANSDKNLDDFLDALQAAGGTENVSVLDLSLASLNSSILANGLNQKVLLIVDDEKGSNIATLNTFVAKSKSSAFVFIDEQNSGLNFALKLASSKDAQKLLWDKKTVMFTNPHRADGVLKSSAMIQSSLAGFMKDMTLANDLTQSATDLVARMKSEINRTSFFTPNNAIKMFSLKAMAEILCINKAYNESGGIFSRDKKWAEMVSNDNTLFLNVLKAASAGDVNEAKLSVVLPAISLKDTLSNAMANADGISRAMMPKIANATNKVLGDMEDSFKKSLKNFNKDLYNKAYDQASIHRPFYIDPPTQPGN